MGNQQHIFRTICWSESSDSDTEERWGTSTGRLEQIGHSLMFMTSAVNTPVGGLKWQCWPVVGATEKVSGSNMKRNTSWERWTAQLWHASCSLAARSVALWVIWRGHNTTANLRAAGDGRQGDDDEGWLAWLTAPQMCERLGEWERGARRHTERRMQTSGPRSRDVTVNTASSPLQTVSLFHSCLWYVTSTGQAFDHFSCRRNRDRIETLVAAGDILSFSSAKNTVWWSCVPFKGGGLTPVQACRSLWHHNPFFLQPIMLQLPNPSHDTRSS